MNRHCLSLAALAAASLVACTTVDPQQTSATGDKPEKVYATGSRIPVRDRSGGSSDVRSVDGQGAAEIMNNRGVIVPGKGGAAN